MTREYILTHTPRQIADENTTDEIDFWANSVPSAFGDDIFGSETSPDDLADSVVTLDDCKALIADWYEDTDEADRPDPEDLQFAYHILAAQYLKLNEGYTFYAVQVFDDDAWDTGSEVWDEALAMAQAKAADPKNNGYEVRIATIEHAGTDDAECTDEDIIREGKRDRYHNDQY